MRNLDYLASQRAVNDLVALLKSPKIKSGPEYPAEQWLIRTQDSVCWFSVEHGPWTRIGFSDGPSCYVGGDRNASDGSISDCCATLSAVMARTGYSADDAIFHIRLALQTRTGFPDISISEHGEIAVIGKDPAGICQVLAFLAICDEITGK